MSSGSSDRNSADDGIDSGYGGSLYNEEKNLDLNVPDLLLNNGLLTESSGRNTVGSHHRSLSMNSRQIATAQVNQMNYNENRLNLARNIEAAKSILRELLEINRTWPVFYPSNNFSSGQSDKGKAPDRGDENPTDEEPRLVPAKSFQVLNLDLTFVGGHENSNIIDGLEKSSLASLLESKVTKTLKHLDALKDRINETASKVLITGDLNSGKSTFCNALLRRKVLPADQQPCTNVFCEVLDAVENQGKEEVHAVFLDVTYDVSDLGTYTIHELRELDDLVYQKDKYSILKIYVDDQRPADQSLLRNGIVDIALIDAPGLNIDSMQTTRLFSRQEEIDMVVFVVSAENYFTLSAKEFITAAAREKSFIFIVVNRFDMIEDQERCQKRIMEQVKELSPQTHKDANDFVHFVSSRDVLNNDSGPSRIPGNGGDGDDGNGDGDGDGSGNSGRPDNLRDFDDLESSFRDFVLEKRSISKLQPAKTYLTNIFTDLELLAKVNIQFATDERDKQLKELDQVNPNYEETLKLASKVADGVDKDIERLCDDMYDHSVKHIRKSMTDQSLPASIKYQGIFSAVEFAVDTREAIVGRILKSVELCEDHARRQTAIAVNSITALGIQHIGKRPEFQRMFREEAMFSKRRDQLGRSVATELELSDFIDIKFPALHEWVPIPRLPSLGVFYGDASDQKTISDGTVATTVSQALTLASVVGGSRAIITSGWAHDAYYALSWLNSDLLKKLAVPAILAASACTIAYIVSDIPQAVPKKLAVKIAKEVEELGYVHSNADRISKECRKVLKYPSRDIRSGFHSIIEDQRKKKEECVAEARKAENGLKYFSKLFRDAMEHKEIVERIRLEHVEVD